MHTYVYGTIVVCVVTTSMWAEAHGSVCLPGGPNESSICDGTEEIRKPMGSTQYSAYTWPWSTAGGAHMTWLAVGVPIKGQGNLPTVTDTYEAFKPVGRPATFSVSGMPPPSAPTLPLKDVMVGV